MWQSYLDEVRRSGISERRVLLLILCNRVLRVERVYAQVAEGGTEEVVLGAVLAEGALKGTGGYLRKKVMSTRLIYL